MNTLRGLEQDPDVGVEMQQNSSPDCDDQEKEQLLLMVVEVHGISRPSRCEIQ